MDIHERLCLLTVLSADMQRQLEVVQEELIKIQAPPSPKKKGGLTDRQKAEIRADLLKRKLRQKPLKR